MIAISRCCSQLNSQKMTVYSIHFREKNKQKSYVLFAAHFLHHLFEHAAIELREG